MAESGTPAVVEVKQRYREVRQRAADAAVRSGRSPDDVAIVAVTKSATIDQIRELVELGHADFGESRAQHLAKRVAVIDEFLERHRTLPETRRNALPERVRWHMIGHLQRNKVRKVIDLVSMIHSVDTLRLAEEIQEAAMKRDEAVDVLLQVNASREESKFGCAMPAARHLAEQIDTMVHLRLRGLMTMAPLTDDVEVIRATFERCRDAFVEIRESGVGGRDFNILSMGMSNDFEIAIECGANLVRVGTAIFGERAIDEESDPDE